MVRLPRPRLTFRLADLPLWGGGAMAVLAAAFFVALPDWRLESAIDATGIANLLPMAAPPLGNTARLLLAVIAAAVAGAVTWSALFLLFGPGGMFHRAPPGDRPVVRRFDAHPDAPPRRPMTAAELGVPAPPPEERPLPADLDQPLAAFDPNAIPEKPLAPPPPVAALARAAPPAPMVVPPAPAAEAPRPAPLPRNDAPPPSIAALLDRLEKGTRRR